MQKGAFDYRKGGYLHLADRFQVLGDQRSTEMNRNLNCLDWREEEDDVGGRRWRQVAGIKEVAVPIKLVSLWVWAAFTSDQSMRMLGFYVPVVVGFYNLFLFD